MSRVQELMAELKEHEWIELSHELDENSPYWEGFPEGCIELNKSIIGWGELDGMEFQVQGHSMVGQFGTHLDVPNHFWRDGKSLEMFSAKDLCLPLVVIDLTDKVAENEDYAIQVSDIEEHEAKYGKIEPGSFVAIRTDWYKRWPDAEKFFQADADGQEHFPGWGIEAMKFLVEERGVIATGHETLDPDAAVLITENGDFVCERYILGTGNYQIEGLQNLDQVPPTGAQIFIACPRIVGASGFTVRVWAIV